MVESAFEDRKNEAEKILEKDVLLREKCRMKMSDLETPMNVRFFKTLEKLEGKAFGNSVREQKEETNLLEEQYVCDLEKLSSLLNFKIHNICFMISDILNTNMIEIDKPEPLERALEIELQDHMFEVYPRSRPPEEPSAMDYHLLKNIKVFSVICDNIFSYEHFTALKSIYTFSDKISEIELDLSAIANNYEGIRLFYSDPYWVTHQIESFTLSLNGYYPDDSLMGLAKNGLLNMTGLKKFNLIIKDSEITDTALQILALYFAKTTANLSKFHLKLWGTEEVTDLDMAELCLRDQSILELCDNANNFLEIKKLALNLCSVNITETNIVMLSDKILSKMSLLESLSLMFITMQLTDQGFIKLCSNLAQIAQNLKKFRLNVADNLITDTSVHHFAKQLLPELKNLNRFELCIGKTAIEDRTVQELCEGFIPILKRAEIFILGGIGEIGAEMILNLVNLESMPDLKTFDICHLIQERRVAQKLRKIKEQLSLRQK